MENLDYPFPPAGAVAFPAELDLRAPIDWVPVPVGEDPEGPPPPPPVGPHLVPADMAEALADTIANAFTNLRRDLCIQSLSLVARKERNQRITALK